MTYPSSPSALFHYDLPARLIAQHPLEKRDQSRMMVLKKGSDEVAHKNFADFPALLPENALVVVNNTRVLPHRIFGVLPGGVEIEALLVEPVLTEGAEGPEGKARGRWMAVVKKARRIKEGMEISFAQGHLPARALFRDEEGRWCLEFEGSETLHSRLQAHGHAPLPPYIKRTPDELKSQDRAAYQTAFARVEGAVAAPTAALHFTSETLSAMRARNLEMAEVTLHVGAGTFAPVLVEDPALHKMHREWFEVPPATALSLKKAKAEKRPIIAVGTTSVRAIETWAIAGAPEEGLQDWSTLFVYPPFMFKMTDGLLTNFHQPQSTLMMLVAAFYGLDPLKKAYSEAVAEEYRFFSYGDCMLILF